MKERSPPQPEQSYDYARWSQIKSLFAKALSLRPAERDAFLGAVCADDADLGNGVRRLLAEHESAANFLAENPRESLSDRRFPDGALLAGRFQVVRLIGHGGMGEVYEAFDTTMRESLAVKTLRPDMTGDAELTGRFRRELQLARQISHANVCRVSEFYEISHENGQPVSFFTMELLNGESLAARIARCGRLRPQDALIVIRQVAAGLSEVHRLGIIHRDLKPANILLVDDGRGGERAVVMDFGLARSNRPEFSGHTSAGMLMGTPTYMAPEQFAKGAITVACDIYALGVTIFEMLTGRSHPLCTVRSVQKDIDSVWDEVLERCLHLDPAKRPASPMDVVELVEVGLKARPFRGTRKAVGAAIGIALTGVGLALWSLSRSAPHHAALLNRLTADSGFTTDPDVSNDGKFLVYASDRGSRGDLNIWMQRLDNGEVTQLTDDPGNEDEPAISPDGKLVAYSSHRDETLYLKPISGPARPLAKWGNNPKISSDGSQIAYWTGQESEHTVASGRVWVVPASGGDSKQLASDFVDARYPAWSPDGRQILFRGARSLRPSMDSNMDWWIVDIAIGAAPPTPTGAWNIFRSAGLTLHDAPAVWDGKQVIFSARAAHTTNLWRIDLSQSRRRASGNPTRLTTSTEYELAPAVFPDGRVAYSDWQFSSHIWRLSRSSQEIFQVTDGDLTDSTPSVSRDGHFLLFGRRLGEERDIWWMNLQSGSQRPLLTHELVVPYISPDGRSIAFSVQNDLYVQGSASSSRSLLCRGCGQIVGWMPDGKTVLLRSNAGSSQVSVDSLELSTRVRRPLLSAPGLHDVAVSPDGQFLAFSVRSQGVVSRIYVARLDAARDATQWHGVTPPDAWADNPCWSDTSTQIFYASRRDGFPAVWRQSIDPVSADPKGGGKTVYRFQRAAFSPATLSHNSFSMSVAGDLIFLNVASIKGNIWALTP